MAELNRVADALKVHPRTILRALAGEVNTYWAPGHNPNVNIATLAEVLGMPAQTLKDAVNGDDYFMSPDEAAEHFNLPLRTFRYRQYPPQMRKGTAVRYSFNMLTKYHEEHYN